MVRLRVKFDGSDVFLSIHTLLRTSAFRETGASSCLKACLKLAKHLTHEQNMLLLLPNYMNSSQSTVSYNVLPLCMPIFELTCDSREPQHHNMSITLLMLYPT